jgi:hypothetical protein
VVVYSSAISRIVSNKGVNVFALGGGSEYAIITISQVVNKPD